MVEVFAVLLAGLAVGTAALVLAPLRWPRPEPAGEAEPTDLLSAREAAVQAIRELDFDYRLGNLAEQDYRSLREWHRRQAIALLKATNGRAAEPEDALDLEIERAVRERRARRRANGRAEGDEVAESIDARDGRPDGRQEAPGGRTRAPRIAPSVRSSGVGARCIAPGDAGPARRASAVPGSEPSSAHAAFGRRPVRWLAGGALVALAVLAGVGWLYLSGRSAQESQRPLAQLPPQVEHVHALAFLPGRAGAALVGHHAGLLATEDGGRSWGPLAAEGDVMALVVHPARPDVVYAAGHDVLLKSEDGGRSWAPLRHDLPGADVHALAVDPDDPSILYAVVVGHGLYRGADGGAHWTLLADRIPTDVVGLAVTSGARRAFYLATADRGLLASADGRDWASASGFVNGALPTLRLTAVASDPRSGDRYVASDGTEYRGALYVGTDRGLYKSVDGGGSWRRLPLQAGVAALAVDPGDSRVLLVVDERGQVFRSEDRGVTWTGAGR